MEGRSEASHIRLSISELICMVTSVPLCKHQKDQWLFLWNGPSAHFSLGFPTEGGRRLMDGCAWSSQPRGPALLPTPSSLH